jgi:hypothetical protein
MYIFGAGSLVATPLQDGYGNAISQTAQTPVLLAVAQEISIAAKFDVKKLYGENQFPVAIARGKGDVSIKVKNANLIGAVLNSLVFGQTNNTNSQLAAYIDRTGTVISGTAVTIVPPTSGVYAYDLGARYGTGVPLTRVASAPTVGQYSVNLATGAYTFATAETGNTVFISYEYTIPNAQNKTGQTITVKNLAMGSQPEVRLDYWTSFQGKQTVITFPRATGNGISMATKLDDFMVPEIDFDCYADGTTNNVLQMGVYE